MSHLQALPFHCRRILHNLVPPGTLQAPRGVASKWPKPQMIYHPTQFHPHSVCHCRFYPSQGKSQPVFSLICSLTFFMNFCYTRQQELAQVLFAFPVGRWSFCAKLFSLVCISVHVCLGRMTRWLRFVVCCRSEGGKMFNRFQSLSLRSFQKNFFTIFSG